MSQEFINAAETVLKQMNRPLLIQDIVNKSIDEGYLKTKGKTPINTMRARLSEHISKFKNNSIFIRVAPNRIALRTWEYQEYKSNPFEKDNNKEIIVSIKQDLVDRIWRFFGFSNNFKPYFEELKDPSNLIFCSRSEAKARFDIKQLVSYVLLKDKKGKVLSYIRGSYGQKESLLKGVLCIGFGGHVNQIEDFNLFGSQDGGVLNSAHREIYEEIKGLRLRKITPIGVINDDSSPLGHNHFAFVFEAELPDGFDSRATSKELSINQVKLLEGKELWERFHELEFWSQILVKQFFNQPNEYNPVFIKNRETLDANAPFVIVGEIGCGKTEVSSYISEKFNIPLISTRDCVARLINEKDFGTGNRSNFQEKAAKLISSKDGIKRIVKEIKKDIKKKKTDRVILDGIRNIETYDMLKDQYPNLKLMYIDVPRDVAYKFYSDRSTDREVTIHEFRDARHHEVEKEITLFKSRSDIYLFNGGTIEDLYKQIDAWNEKKNL